MTAAQKLPQARGRAAETVVRDHERLQTARLDLCMERRDAAARVAENRDEK